MSDVLCQQGCDMMFGRAADGSGFAQLLKYQHFFAGARRYIMSFVGCLPYDYKNIEKYIPENV